VLLALPVAPLCRDDCPGPEPEGFPVEIESDESTDGDEPSQRDPRWAALDQLRDE
jgi:uncharacterized protein